jgi:hypothetical protein
MWLSFKNGVKGKVPEIKQALAGMSGWDEVEEVTMNTNALVTNAGVLGDGNNGVGDGKARNLLYCGGIHNNTALDITIVYENIMAGAGKSFTLYIPAGGGIWPLVPIIKILGTGSGTSASKMALFYRDRLVLDGFTGEVRD